MDTDIGVLGIGYWWAFRQTSSLLLGAFTRRTKMRTLLDEHHAEQHEAEIAAYYRQHPEERPTPRAIGLVLGVVLQLIWYFLILSLIEWAASHAAHGAPITASPKVQSQQPPALSVPLVQPPITVTVSWLNPRQTNWHTVSNQLAITPPGMATIYTNMQVTNTSRIDREQAQVTGPSNTVIRAMTAAIGADGSLMLSDPSNPVTNTAPIAASVWVTNGATYYWVTTTNLALPFQSNSLLPSLRITNNSGWPEQLWLKLAVQTW